MPTIRPSHEYCLTMAYNGTFIPVNLFIYNDNGVGFVELLTDNEVCASHPFYRSLVSKLTDGNSKVKPDLVAVDTIAFI